MLRPMRWWDLQDVLPLEEALFEDAWSEALYWSELAQGGNRTYLVATTDEQVIGYAGLAVYPDEAYVQTLGVDPAHQRRGVATLLLVALMRDARHRGLDVVGLEVRVDNVGAQALYRRFGFAPVGLRKGYYQPSNVDALVMLATGVLEPEYVERLDDIEESLAAAAR